MSKLLEKTLKDALKEKKCVLGTKQVLDSLTDSKLIVMSESIPNNTLEKIENKAKKDKVPITKYHGSSVALGRLCGLQFRVSTASLTSVTETNIQSILKESEKNWC